VTTDRPQGGRLADTRNSGRSYVTNDYGIDDAARAAHRELATTNSTGS
jgi:hypothetical protein